MPAYPMRRLTIIIIYFSEEHNITAVTNSHHSNTSVTTPNSVNGEARACIHICTHFTYRAAYKIWNKIEIFFIHPSLFSLINEVNLTSFVALQLFSSSGETNSLMPNAVNDVAMGKWSTLCMTLSAICYKLTQKIPQASKLSPLSHGPPFIILSAIYPQNDPLFSSFIFINNILYSKLILHYPLARNISD